jgi:hypothetical protein
VHHCLEAGLPGARVGRGEIVVEGAPAADLEARDLGSGLGDGAGEVVADADGLGQAELVVRLPEGMTASNGFTAAAATSTRMSEGRVVEGRKKVPEGQVGT